VIGQGKVAPAGRFAPSPTGDLHFGSLLAALASYCDVRQRRGRWTLRIDDIDGPRMLKGSADSIQRTLENYGFQWDGPILWQSSHAERYHTALCTLAEKGLLFVCNCSRRTLPRGQIYPGRCREHRVLTVPSAIAVTDHALRMRMQGEACFDDAIQGNRRFDLAADVGDSIVWRRDGLVSYALACAVDDASDVTHVVRGADLLESTGAQLGIIAALGLTPPRYAHFPVAVDVNGDKLSKHSRARPIDETAPLVTLLQAWHFLGQIELKATSLREFWHHAEQLWDVDRVPQVHQLTWQPGG
jgi:glutamyl-Q tRNA(Asp) synthetase